MQCHVGEGNSKVNESEDDAAGLCHSFEGNSDDGACGAEQRVENVVAEGAGETIENLARIADKGSSAQSSPGSSSQGSSSGLHHSLSYCRATVNNANLCLMARGNNKVWCWRVWAYSSVTL